MIRGGNPRLPLWARRVRLAIALVGFHFALLSGAVLHLDLPASRNAAARLTSSWMTRFFRGSTTIGSLSRLHAGGFTAHDVLIRDPQERPVLAVGRLVVDVNLLGIVERIVGGHEKISIEIQDVVFSDVDVFFHDTEEVDDAGEVLEYPSIADAFTPADPGPQAQEETTKPVRVWLPDVKLERVYGRGSIAGSPVLEMRVDEASARVLATEKGAAVDIPSFDIEASGIGGVDTRVRGTVHVRAPGAVYGEVNGYIGQIPVEQKFRFEADSVQLHGSLPELRPEDVRPLFPEWPLDQTISVENRVSGVPPRFEVTGVVRAGEGLARVHGVVRTDPGLEADLDVDAEGLDLSRLHGDWPQSELHLRSAAEVWRGPEGPHVELNATLLPSKLEGTRLPVVDFRINYDERGVVGEATLHEKGLPAHLELRRASSGPTEFQLSLRRTRLQDSPRLAEVLNARGTVEGTIDGRLEEERLTLSTNISGVGVGYDDFAAGGLRLTGTAEMSLDAVFAATVDLKLDATSAELGPARLKDLQAKVQGPLLQPQFEMSGTTGRDAQLSGKGRARTDRVEFTGLTFELEGKGKRVDVSATTVSYDQGHFVLRDFDLKSEGSIRADLDLHQGRGRAVVHARDLNVSRILKALDARAGGLGGRLDADVDIDIGEHSSGTIAFELRDGSYEGLTGIDLASQIQLDGQRSEGTFSTRLDDLGRVSGTWDITADGPVFSPDSYPDAAGKFEAAVSGVDLATLGMLLRGQSDVIPTGGTARAELTIERRSASQFPRVEAMVRTDDLALDVLREDGALHVDGIDIEINGAADGTSNQVQIAARLVDPLGDVASGSGTIRLPLTRWIEAPPNLKEAIETMQTSPLELVLSIPDRRLVDFPAIVPMPDIGGTLSGRGVLRGSYREPNVDLSMTAQGVGGMGTGLSAPLDADATLRYRKATGELWGDLKASQGARRIGAASFSLLVPFDRLLAPSTTEEPFWTGDIQVLLDGAPLELLQPLEENELRGNVQGSIAVARTGLTPSLAANLRVRRLAVGERPLGEGTIEARSDQNRILASARFDDEYGTLETTAEFGTQPVPWGLHLAENVPIFVSLSSDSYDAAVLSPFLNDVFSEFRGTLNGQLRVEIAPPSQPGEEWDTSLSGKMSMTEGVMTPRPMGLRLEGTDFDVTAAREGQFNVVRLTDLRARARADVYNVKGNAIAYFDNLQFVKARFNLSHNRLPILNDGTLLADASGKASGELVLEEDEFRLDLQISKLLAVLPSATEDLIELSDNPTIEILQPIAPREEEEQEAGGPALRVKVRLGKDVRVMNRLLNLEMSGEPELYFGDELFVKGRLELTPGGKVQVLRRDFVIDYGTVLFDNPDPGNPHLDVAASWRAATGTLVRANVSGTANDPVIEWTSEPPLPEGEIVALILGGGGGSGEDAGSGGGISYAAAAVTELLGQSGLKGFALRASTDTGGGEGQVARLSERRWDSYTAAFQVSEKLWFEGSYHEGTAGPVSEPRSGFSGTLDWRFKPNWSARTEVGTLGFGLDLLWQYRY